MDQSLEDRPNDPLLYTANPHLIRTPFDPDSTGARSGHRGGVDAMCTPAATRNSGSKDGKYLCYMEFANVG